MKLYKNNQRNRLHEKSLEDLMLVHQEHHSDSEFKITGRIIEIYQELKASLNARKSESSPNKKILPIVRNYSQLPSLSDDESQGSPPLMLKKTKISVLKKRSQINQMR